MTTHTPTRRGPRFQVSQFKRCTSWKSNSSATCAIVCTLRKKWEEWHKVLGKFGTFYDRASKVPATGTISPPTPSLSVPQNFIPSPPVNIQTSPPTTTYSPNHLAFSNTPLLQPQATSAQVSPIGSLPPLGPIVQRKRSTDHSAEPPMKRQAHGFAPGPYSNAPLVPTLQTPVTRSFDPPPSVNRLPPLPSLAIPPPQHMPPAQIKNWSELPLPVPGNRSMAMVYPPPVQWQQPVSTPTSSAAPPFLHTTLPPRIDLARSALIHHRTTRPLQAHHFLLGQDSCRHPIS